MRTSKPITTISYNSQEFLLHQLNELIKRHIISDFAYINHFAEEDEKKSHIHLWLKPNTLIDTMNLQEHFTEIDLNRPNKPLKCIDFRSGSIDDWILYSEHFEPYLRFKGESRQYHYTKDDFVFNDQDTFDDLYNHAHKGSEFAKRFQILDALRRSNGNPAELVLDGTVPLQLAGCLNAVKQMDARYGNGSGTYRGNRPNHEREISDGQ